MIGISGLSGESEFDGPWAAERGHSRAMLARVVATQGGVLPLCCCDRRLTARLLLFARADVVFVDVRSSLTPVQTSRRRNARGEHRGTEDGSRRRGTDGGRARGPRPAFSHLRDADPGRRTRSPYSHTVEEAAGRPVTVLLPADRPDEEPMILERNQASPRLEHPRSRSPIFGSRRTCRTTGVSTST